MFRTNIPFQVYEMKLLYKALVELDKKESSFQSKKLIAKLEFFYNELNPKISLSKYLSEQESIEDLEYYADLNASVCTQNIIDNKPLDDIKQIIEYLGISEDEYNHLVIQYKESNDFDFVYAVYKSLFDKALAVEKNG